MTPNQQHTRLSLEMLESRVNPVAFTWSAAGSTLILTQTAGTVGALTLADDGVGSLTVTDAGSPPALTIATSGFANLTVNLLGADTPALTYNLTGVRTGNVTFHVANNAARTFTLGGGGTIGGNFSLKGGNGALTVNGTAPTIAGNASFTGGNALDILNLSGTPTIGGNLSLNKFNEVTLLTGSSIGGSFTANSTSEFTNNQYALTGVTIGGSFTYLGGARRDRVDLDGPLTIGGNYFVSFGEQLPGLTSRVRLEPGTLVGGSVTVIGGNLGTDNINLRGAIAGNIYLNLKGGANDLDTVAATSIFSGSSFTYIGGSGVDDVRLRVSSLSARMRVFAQLGAGDDIFRFSGTQQPPSFAYIDFGAGVDSVTGTINFPFTFLNLP
jgi:hypothetical protein